MMLCSKILYAQNEQRIISNGLTLVEILIVVAVIGILAAIIAPEYRNYTQKAKESVAKENLQIFRNAIEQYSIKYNGIPPGYSENDTSSDPGSAVLYFQLVKSEKLLQKFPENPFNNLQTVLVLKDSESLPESATGNYGWLYKPDIKSIKIDSPGTDTEGIEYFSY